VTGSSKAPLISIVDDDALARDGIRELVESLGYKTSTFESAEHFLGSSMLAQTACLITDLQMPGLNGLELQEELRSQGYCTAVILITAYPNENHRKRALNGGAVGFLSKPFDERSLIKCLTAAIKSSNRQASMASHSSRNQLNGKVTEVKRGVTTTHVRIDIGGEIVTASITNESADELKLEKGKTAHAIIKASSVMLGVD
jgi:molybdopterin-binding protein